MEYLAHTEEGFALHYNPNSDAMHWKYIRKYKSSKGKWVYVYPKDKLKIKNFIDTKITGNAYKQHASDAQKSSSDYSRIAYDRYSAAAGAHAKAKNWDDVERAKSYERQSESFYRIADKYKQEAAQAWQNYKYDSFVGRSETAISRGKEWIADNLEALAKKIRY